MKEKTKVDRRKFKKTKVQLGLPYVIRRLFSFDEGIFLEFKRHCLKKKVKMSNVLQAFMHRFNIKNTKSDK